MTATRPRRRLIATLTIVALFLGAVQVASAQAGYSYYQTIYKYIYAPNVTIRGHLSYTHAKQAQCKVIKNYYTGKCTAIVDCYVKNFSRKNQYYYNIGLIPPYLCNDCHFYSDKYVVYSNGYASGIAWGYIKYGYGGGPA